MSFGFFTNLITSRVLSTVGGGGGGSSPKSFPEKKYLKLFQIKIFFTTILRNQ